MPGEPWRRAQTRLWMKRVDEFLHPGCTTVTFATANRKHFLETMTPEQREERYARNPNAERRAIQRDCIEHGLDAPRVGTVVKQYDEAFADMERQLDDMKWLSGRDFGLADICMIPYVNRLSLIAMDSLWTRNRPNVTDWFERVMARPSFQEAVTRWMTDDDHDRFIVPRDEVEGKLWEVLAV
jgi:glutathione S-transferase